MKSRRWNGRRASLFVFSLALSVLLITSYTNCGEFNLNNATNASSAGSGTDRTSGGSDESAGVDSTAPVIAFTKNPSVLSTGTTAEFVFSITDSGSGVGAVQCSFNGAAFSDCTSPLSFSGLTVKAHSFRVQAKDKAGNTALIQFNWTIIGSEPLPQMPAWVSSLPLWEWYQIPNTSLKALDDAVLPSPRPIGWTGAQSKITTWTGAALRRKDSVYMFGAAGGHADYGGNEVDALVLNSETPRWLQLRGPTPNAYLVSSTAYNLQEPDGKYRPSASHTYYSTQFIDKLDRMMVFPALGSFGGSFPAAPADFPYKANRYTFSFNMATGDWDAPEFVSLFPGTGERIASLVVKHPVTEDVYYSSNYGDGIYKWSVTANTWTKLPGSSSRSPWYSGAAIDPVRNRMLIVGGYSATAPVVLGLDGLRVPGVAFSGAAADLNLSGYPGVIYDEANDLFLVFSNGAANIEVRQVNPETWYVDTPVMTGTPPAKRPNGIHNSVQYVPELRGFVVANSYTGNVYFMRTAH